MFELFLKIFGPTPQKHFGPTRLPAAVALRLRITFFTPGGQTKFCDEDALGKGKILR